MNEADVRDIELDNPLQFWLNRIREIQDFFIAEINGREKMRKTLIKFGSPDEILFVLPGASNGDSN